MLSGPGNDGWISQALHKDDATARDSHADGDVVPAMMYKTACMDCQERRSPMQNGHALLVLCFQSPSCSFPLFNVDKVVKA